MIPSMPTKTITPWYKRPAFLYGIFVLFLAYFTYVHNYWHPPQLFWDENYHIASAQKYLNGVHFMEPHPPLGKLLIAWGEKIVDGNALDNQFIGTDYGRKIPEGFSFAGYRLFPTILAWLTAIVVYLIFLQILKHPIFAVLLSFLYVFDNALIVHSRGAMLESTLLFFCLSMILITLVLVEKWKEQRWRRICSTLLGFCFACALATKVNALVMILVFPYFIWQCWGHKKEIWEMLGLSLIGFLIPYFAIWQTHFALGTKVIKTLPDRGYYQASETYKGLIDEGKTRNPMYFPVMLRDSWAFLPHYQRGVPKLDLCKSGENGSPFFLWPIGARTINYRWETPDSNEYLYLYLQSNPVGWLFGLTGVILTASLVIGSFLLPLKKPLEYRPQLILFLGLYIGYMGAMSMITRVMYLYHYFPPLVFSFCLLGMSIKEINIVGKWKVEEAFRTSLVLTIAALTFVSFQFFRPLTYYQPITDEAFQKRAWLNIWNLKCVNCEVVSPIVKKQC